MTYSDIERRLKALEAIAPPGPDAPRHIVVDLVALSLAGQLTEDDRRRRIKEARQQARPQDMVIVINCRGRGGEA